MIKNLLFALLLTVLFSCGRNPGSGSGESAVNVESVDAFFVFAEKMVGGGEITDKDWGELFSTPGYAILTDHFGEELMKECISLGFSPERRDERDAFIGRQLTEEEFMDRNRVLPWFMAGNFADMQGHWDELKNFRASFDFDGLEAEATALLRDYLIDPVDSLIEFPRLTFVCMDNNARSLDQGIVMDLNHAYSNTFTQTAEGMAHEMFHTYRSGLMNRDFIFSDPLVWALSVVQNEGMADQLDKEPYRMPDNLDELEEGYRIYHRAYVDTELVLARLDRATIAFLDGEISEEEFDVFTDDLFIFDGHPNGFYMTSLIREQGLMDEMVRDPANPAAFARVYNRAAEAAGAFVFSPQVMEYLEQLESRYLL
ncbi:MAG: hypothetical protein LIO85_08310 [Rikenellaceae bacterium]|nr:hypothetical protein [Rikenellaceae bacterium]